MIAEELQDQAALYVLGALDASAAGAFESAMSRDRELRELVRQLRDAAAALTLTAPSRIVPPDLKDRVLGAVAQEKEKVRKFQPVSPTTIAASWLPWAIAAVLTICCVLLALNQQRLRRDLAEARTHDSLQGAVLIALAPSENGPREAKATVAWDSTRQVGLIRIINLPAASSSKDYQLWAVDADHKDPVSAGVVRVDEKGVAQIRFQPVEAAHKVKAFAISLEREGGAPKKQGPILLVGTV